VGLALGVQDIGQLIRADRSTCSLTAVVITSACVFCDFCSGVGQESGEVGDVYGSLVLHA
jgi:hypothetical protein